MTAQLTFPTENYYTLIRQLKHDGYKFLTCNQNYVGGKAVYLIHCADFRFTGAYTFMKAEQTENVKSTFMMYPNSPFFLNALPVFNRLQRDGWALGYEYDTFNRADGDMAKAIMMFRDQVADLRSLGFNISVTDSHGDVTYNGGAFNSYEIYRQHPELWSELDLKNLFTLPNFEGYMYFSDSEFTPIILPTNLSDKLIIECHTDWY